MGLPAIGAVVVAAHMASAPEPGGYPTTGSARSGIGPCRAGDCAVSSATAVRCGTGLRCGCLALYLQLAALRACRLSSVGRAIHS